MTISKKIELAAKYKGISLAELARRWGTTPQNLHNRMKVDKFSTAELEAIAAAMGARLEVAFVFEDGEKV